MKVQVLSGYDTVKEIQAKHLKRMIAGKEIIAFRRTSGWVKIGIDPVRGEGGAEYDGPERRNVVQKTLSQELKHKFLCVLGIRGPKVDW